MGKALGNSSTVSGVRAMSWSWLSKYSDLFCLSWSNSDECWLGTFNRNADPFQYLHDTTGRYRRCGHSQHFFLFCPLICEKS